VKANPQTQHGAMKKKDKRVRTPGRQFFDEQITLLQQARTDELIEKHYHEDAVLISTANIVRGCEDLKVHFRAYVNVLTKIDLSSGRPQFFPIQAKPAVFNFSLDAFIETDNSILLEATMRSALGETKVYDAFVLRDGKVTHHFTGVKSMS
jgi:hypothetical protein